MMNPYCVSIEPTRGCTRRCSFCAIHSIVRSPEDRECKFMSVATADLISSQILGWLDKFRLCFALFGEPALNPDILEIVGLFRKRFPKAAITMISNGDPLLDDSVFSKDRVQALFNSGINSLAIDYYGKPEGYREFRDNAFSAVGSDIECIDLYNTKGKYFASWQTYKPPQKTKELVLVDNNIGFTKLRMGRKWDNQGGNVSPDRVAKFKQLVEVPIKSRCAQPFRDLAISWDGVVVGCCLDWRREMCLGKISEDLHIRDIWNSRQQLLRQKALYEKDRFVLPCKRCDYASRRTGLLKNPMASWGNSEKQELFALQKENGKYSDKYAFKDW